MLTRKLARACICAVYAVEHSHEQQRGKNDKKLKLNFWQVEVDTHARTP